MSKQAETEPSSGIKLSSSASGKSYLDEFGDKVRKFFGLGDKRANSPERELVLTGIWKSTNTYSGNGIQDIYSSDFISDGDVGAWQRDSARLFENVAKLLAADGAGRVSLTASISRNGGFIEHGTHVNIANGKVQGSQTVGTGANLLDPASLTEICVQTDLGIGERPNAGTSCQESFSVGHDHVQVTVSRDGISIGLYGCLGDGAAKLIDVAYSIRCGDTVLGAERDLFGSKDVKEQQKPGIYQDRVRVPRY